MRQFSLIFILSFLLQISFGQVLTKDEAYAFADKLLEVEILSERGRNMLKMQIDLNQDGNQPMDIESAYVTGASFKKNISISYVLDFCFFAFQNEQAFRMGMEMIDVISKKYAEENRKQYLDEADLEAVNKIFIEQSQDFECLKIEDRIPNEEGYLEEEGLVRSINFGRKIEKRLIHESRSVMGKTRSRTARDLFEMGLISEKVFDAIIEKIKLKELNTELAVVGFAKYQIKIEENFPIEKAAELKILNNLKRVDLLSEAKYQELTHSKNANRVLGRFEIFSQCKNAKTLKRLDKGEEAMVCFLKMLEEIKAFIPDFDYKNFDYRMEKKSFGMDEYYFGIESKIQLHLDGTTYRSAYVQDFINEKETPNWTMGSVNISYQGSVLRLANKILANRNSPQRLYSFTKNEYKEGEGMTILLMTEEQFKAWDDPYGMYFYPEDHNNFFTVVKLNELISNYELIGLFNHLTKEEIEEGRKKVHEATIYSYVDILLLFPNLVVDFDWEYDNMNNPYEELINEFAKASKGNFKPENIKDDFSENLEKEFTSISFEVSGKKYERNLMMMGDWLDGNFLYLLNDAIKAVPADGKFYDCIHDEQYDGYIFLTDRQFEFFKKNQPELFYKNNSND